MRNVIVLIVGDYESQYINIKFDSAEMLNQQIEKSIVELGIGCVSVIIEDVAVFSSNEILFLIKNDIEIWLYTTPNIKFGVY